jgi:hypothetical protein
VGWLLGWLVMWLENQMLALYTNQNSNVLHGMEAHYSKPKVNF